MQNILQKAVPFFRKQIEQKAEDYYKFSADELIQFISNLLPHHQSDPFPKVIRDNNVAVIYTPIHGAGFSSWNPNIPELIYDPDIVTWIENNKSTPIPDLEKKYGTYVYIGGLDNAKITWLPIGTKFRIHEYDGCETIITDQEETYYTT